MKYALMAAILSILIVHRGHSETLTQSAQVE